MEVLKCESSKVLKLAGTGDFAARRHEGREGFLGGMEGRASSRPRHCSGMEPQRTQSSQRNFLGAGGRGGSPSCPRARRIVRADVPGRPKKPGHGQARFRRSGTSRRTGMDRRTRRSASSRPAARPAVAPYRGRSRVACRGRDERCSSVSTAARASRRLPLPGGGVTPPHSTGGRPRTPEEAGHGQARFRRSGTSRRTGADQRRARRSRPTGGSRGKLALQWRGR